MKFIALGTGTCLPPPPGHRVRMPPLFALDISPPGVNPSWLVFDCSEGARWRLPEHGISLCDVHHIAVSHPHADHAAIPQFVQSRACESIFGETTHSLSLDLYLPPLPAATLSSLWSWHQPEDRGRATSRFRFTVHALPDGWSQEIVPGVILRAFAVNHGRSPAVAFRVEAHGAVFAYSGDSAPCDGLLRAAHHADLFVCEASARVGTDLSKQYGHCNPRQAGDVARMARAHRVWLTHYSGQDSDSAVLSDASLSGFSGEIRVAHDGDFTTVVGVSSAPP
jgi:ribonuclease BN (tRNA processing enzyme)